MKFWLESARRFLLHVLTSRGIITDRFKAEKSMSASASDLKSAYIHFTRVAVILDEIVPQHSHYDSLAFETLTDV